MGKEKELASKQAQKFLDDMAEQVEKIKGKEPKEFAKEDAEYLVGKDGLIRYHKKIIKILKEYMDLKPEYYSLVALWIMGTYLHKQFSTYPYLYFNAMKGSGKTRILKLISNMSNDGKMVGSMTEAVLFRTAKESSFCIDEIEGINSKGKENLKLLLNSAYKKGLDVERLTEKKTVDGKKQVVERFKVYCPIALANIWGLDNTLADRCITLILERSDKMEIVRLIENFEHNIEIDIIKGGLKRLTEKLTDEFNFFGDVITDWNKFVKNEKMMSKIPLKDDINDINDIKTALYLKIDKTKIFGRDLELFMPIFLIADMCSNKILSDILSVAKELVKSRKEADREENRDVQMLEFISKYKNDNFVNVSVLVSGFKDFCGLDEKDKYVNTRSVGMGLRRLGLVIEAHRTGKGRQVRLNIEKAKEKILMFKDKKDVNDGNDDIDDIDDIDDKKIEVVDMTKEKKNDKSN